MKNVTTVIALATTLFSVSAFAADHTHLGKSTQIKTGAHYKNIEQVTVDAPNLPVSKTHDANLFAGSK